MGFLKKSLIFFIFFLTFDALCDNFECVLGGYYLNMCVYVCVCVYCNIFLGFFFFLTFK
jgi:hypothetical protein